MTKKNKENNFFFVFWARQGLLITPTYLHSSWRIRVTSFFM